MRNKLYKRVASLAALFSLHYSIANKSVMDIFNEVSCLFVVSSS